MKRVVTAVATALLTVTLFLIGQTPGKEKTATQPPAVQPAALSNEDLNLRAYMELLRSDVLKEKTNLMSQVMQLEPDQAAKFWPLYNEYDAELKPRESKSWR